MSNEEEICIETLKRLRIRAGDAMLVKVPFPMSKRSVEKIRSQINDLVEFMEIGGPIKVVVMDSGIDIEVLSKET